MFRPIVHKYLIATLLIGMCMSSLAGAADKPKKSAKKKSPPANAVLATAQKKFAHLKAPKKGVTELQEYIRQVRLNRPTSLEEFVVLQLKLRTAATRIIAQSKDKKDQAVASSSALLRSTLPNVVGYLSAEEQRKELKNLVTALSKKKIGPRDLQLCMMLGRGLEMAESYKIAASTYESFASIMSKSSSTNIAATAHLFRGAVERVKLVGGKALPFTGTNLDGSKFDLKALRGKVVLIDFWATWCGPCIAEFPNMKTLYAKYKKQGFEIVGLSIDRDRTSLESFMKKRKLPWMILHERGEHPAVRKYGINAIPQMMLVNRKGVVISLSARGKNLELLLEKEFKAKNPKK